MQTQIFCFFFKLFWDFYSLTSITLSSWSSRDLTEHSFSRQCSQDQAINSCRMLIFCCSYIVMEVSYLHPWYFCRSLSKKLILLFSLVFIFHFFFSAWSCFFILLLFLFTPVPFLLHPCKRNLFAEISRLGKPWGWKLFFVKILLVIL